MVFVEINSETRPEASSRSSAVHKRIDDSFLEMVPSEVHPHALRAMQKLMEAGIAAETLRTLRFDQFVDDFTYLNLPKQGTLRLEDEAGHCVALLNQTWREHCRATGTSMPSKLMGDSQDEQEMAANLPARRQYISVHSNVTRSFSSRGGPLGPLEMDRRRRQAQQASAARTQEVRAGEVSICKEIAAPLRALRECLQRNEGLKISEINGLPYSSVAAGRPFIVLPQGVIPLSRESALKLDTYLQAIRLANLSLSIEGLDGPLFFNEALEAVGPVREISFSPKAKAAGAKALAEYGGSSAEQKVKVVPSGARRKEALDVPSEPAPEPRPPAQRATPLPIVWPEKKPPPELAGLSEVAAKALDPQECPPASASAPEVTLPPVVQDQSRPPPDSAEVLISTPVTQPSAGRDTNPERKAVRRSSRVRVIETATYPETVSARSVARAAVPDEKPAVPAVIIEPTNELSAPCPQSLTVRVESVAEAMDESEPSSGGDSLKQTLGALRAALELESREPRTAPIDASSLRQAQVFGQRLNVIRGVLGGRSFDTPGSASDDSAFFVELKKLSGVAEEVDADTLKGVAAALHEMKRLVALRLRDGDDKIRNARDEIGLQLEMLLFVRLPQMTEVVARRLEGAALHALLSEAKKFFEPQPHS